MFSLEIIPITFPWVCVVFKVYTIDIYNLRCTKFLKNCMSLMTIYCKLKKGTLKWTRIFILCIDLFMYLPLLIEQIPVYMFEKKKGDYLLRLLSFGGLSTSSLPAPTGGWATGTGTSRTGWAAVRTSTGTTTGWRGGSRPTAGAWRTEKC